MLNSTRVLSIKPKSLDFVFVDGRYRAACALHAYSLLKDDGILAIHDYLDRAPRYQIIESFYTIIEKADTGAIFKKKFNIDEKERVLQLESYLSQYFRRELNEEMI